MRFASSNRARFDDRVTGKLDEFAARAKVIHIDIDPAEVGKNRQPEVPIVGDVRAVLQKLLSQLDQQDKPDPQQTRAWLDKIHTWRTDFAAASSNLSRLNFSPIGHC